VALLFDGESGGRLIVPAGRALLAQTLRGAGVPDYAARLREIAVEADAGIVRASGLILAADEIVAIVESLGGRPQ